MNCNSCYEILHTAIVLQCKTESGKVRRYAINQRCFRATSMSNVPVADAAHISGVAVATWLHGYSPEMPRLHHAQLLH